MPRILIVEDDDDLVSLISEKLLECGYEIRVTNDGKQALKALTDETFDLVLTDIVLPEKEGIETIRELKRTRPTLPIIAMSGGGLGPSGLYLELAKRFGATRTIAKPFTMFELVSLIQEVLGLG